MKINQNNEISVYRGETAAIDFKMSQRYDYYVPFLISSERVNPMVCITIGSTRRENVNIVSKKLWLEVDTITTQRFNQTIVTDLGTLSAAAETAIDTLMTEGVMYQFLRESEVEADGDEASLHFAYLDNEDEVQIDTYEFVVILAVDDTITSDMTNTDYFYQIELMDTVPMIEHIQSLITANPNWLNKLPNDFTNTEEGISKYITECIAIINKALPNHWGYKIIDPVSSPVASVNNIQMLQPPRKFTVQSTVR